MLWALHAQNVYHRAATSQIYCRKPWKEERNFNNFYSQWYSRINTVFRLIYIPFADKGTSDMIFSTRNKRFQFLVSYFLVLLVKSGMHHVDKILIIMPTNHHLILALQILASSLDVLQEKNGTWKINFLNLSKYISLCLIKFIIKFWTGFCNNLLGTSVPLVLLSCNIYLCIYYMLISLSQKMVTWFYLKFSCSYKYLPLSSSSIPPPPVKPFLEPILNQTWNKTLHSVVSLRRGLNSFSHFVPCFSKTFF